MRSCLVTGATGTLGQALVRELLAGDTERICIYSRDEYKQFTMRHALDDPDKRLRWFIGDVRDVTRLKRAFEGVEVVIHAAAMKHVEACEGNPFEAVQTNIIGAQNVIEAALDCGVDRVLAVSTDKAANPSTLYGATKLCAERVFLAAKIYAGRHGAKFSCVRFGNIAFSRGSVIPKWQGIKWHGGTMVPVTDPECTRYWITAKDASRFAIKALEFEPGQVHVHEMPAFRVRDLALAMNVEMDIKGLGPGERLHEDGSEFARRMTVEELRGLVT